MASLIFLSIWWSVTIVSDIIAPIAYAFHQILDKKL